MWDDFFSLNTPRLFGLRGNETGVAPVVDDVTSKLAIATLSVHVWIGTKNETMLMMPIMVSCYHYSGSGRIIVICVVIIIVVVSLTIGIIFTIAFYHH